MSDEVLDLNRIRRQEQAAPVGPYEWEYNEERDSWLVGCALDDEGYGYSLIEIANDKTKDIQHLAPFIAAAREDVPALVALCDELAGVLQSGINAITFLDDAETMEEKAVVDALLDSFVGRAEDTLTRVIRLTEVENDPS